MTTTQKLGSFSGAIRAALMNAALATAETQGTTLFVGIISGSEEKGLVVKVVEHQTLTSDAAYKQGDALGIMTPCAALVQPLIEKLAKRAEKAAPKEKKANPPKAAAKQPRPVAGKKAGKSATKPSAKPAKKK